MSERLRRLLPATAACIAVAVLASCAAPRNDGGIVGSGNRPDCETRSDGTPVPEECKRSDKASR